MLLLESLQHGGDELHVGVPHSCMDLIRGGTLAPGRSSWIHHVILQLAGVGMHLLQQLTPAHTP